MHSFRKILLFLLALTVIFTGCEKNPSAPEHQNPSASKSQNLSGYSTIIVTVEYDNGNPLEGIEIECKFQKAEYSWQTRRKITDKNGLAVFDSLNAGNYKILIHEFPGFDNPEYIEFRNDLVLKENQTIETNFSYPTKLTLNVLVVGPPPENKPIRRAEISTSPETVTIITDKNGRAVFENIPLREYKINIELIYSGSFGLPIKKLNFRNGQLADWVFHESESIFTNENIPPFVEIISPETNLYQNRNDIHFVGEGYDYKDGELQGESLIWYSDIDGKLGTGREITVERLNIGHHTIKLIGIDSDQNETKDSIELYVSFFDEQTYYPVPYEGYWNYQYNNTNFSFTNFRGETEYWSLKDLKVSTSDVNTRNSLMEYTITKDEITNMCKYSVIDYYETDSSNIYVSKTTEQLIIYDDNTAIDEPIEQIDIETVFSPRYLLIKNHMDFSSESFYEATVTANTIWSYYHSNFGSKTYTETIDVITSYDIGDTEIISTNYGTFKTVPLISTIGDTVRKWWLARGIGIVQLEFNTFEFPLSATLYDTNIFSFFEFTMVEKTALSSSSAVFLKELHSPPDTSERMLELCRLLRGLCPQ